MVLAMIAPLRQFWLGSRGVVSTLAARLFAARILGALSVMSRHLSRKANIVVQDVKAGVAGWRQLLIAYAITGIARSLARCQEGQYKARGDPLNRLLHLFRSVR